MDALSYKTVFANKATANKEWLVVDANGKVLGRVASEIAKLVRGKNKTNFTPNVDCGDNVIVINADKIVLTGNKWEAKEYVSYSLYPGGQKRVAAKDMKAKSATTIVEKAVKGMLPKNRLGRELFRNLFVYVGAEHPHAAQQPKSYEF